MRKKLLIPIAVTNKFKITKGRKIKLTEILTSVAVAGRTMEFSLDVNPDAVIAPSGTEPKVK